MKKVCCLLLALLFCGAPAVAQELPFKLWYGLTENKAATEYSKYTNNPKRVMEKTISVTSLQKGLIINTITVNRGNVIFANHVQKLPITLDFGQKYEVREFLDSSVDAAIEEAKKKNMRQADANNLIAMAMLQAKDSDVIEIAITLGDGRAFAFDVGNDALVLAKVTSGTPQQPIAPGASQAQNSTKPPATQPSANGAPAAVNSRQIELTGKAESFREVGMSWIRLHTGQGKPVHVGALGNFSDDVRACLENAAESQQSVTVRGTLLTYEGGDSGMDENTVQCTPAAKSISPKTLKLTDSLHSKYSLESEQYALADALLNATWKQVKGNVSDAQYKQILQEQRQWASKGRDAAASRYAASMPEAEAFAKAMQDRTVELTKLVTAEPSRGTFSNPYGEFSAVLQGNMVLVEGDAHNEQGNLCGFDGKGTVGKGWITMKHDNYPDFYLLFTAKGAQIAYATSGGAQGCGANVGFSGAYTKK